MIRDAVFFNQRDKVPLRVSAKCRFAEVQISADEARSVRVEIREIAPSTARHQDLLADPVGSLKHDDVAAALPGSNCTQEASGSSTNHDYVGMFHAGRITVLPWLRSYHAVPDVLVEHSHALVALFYLNCVLMSFAPKGSFELPITT